MAGGALIGGLGGGSIFTAAGGAAGAGLSSKLAGQAKALSDSVGSETGAPLIGNISSNIFSGLIGGLIGGSAGAAMASDVNLYNQGHDDGDASAAARAKAIAQRLVDAVRQTMTHPWDSVSYAVSSSLPRLAAKPDADADPLELTNGSLTPGFHVVHRAFVCSTNGHVR
ncbi:MAG: hypothetical protein WDN30_02815 [Pararobbsia sp.]